MKKVAKHLEEMGQAARALALYAEDLRRFLEAHPLSAPEVAPEVEGAVRALRALVSRLYALEARLKAPYEDNSAEALRELFGEV
ncbi:hypothetical protein [Thermus sp.]|jgi:BMFP domain-containing protein YqiC|uniref:hypothetical protein n=1 Tax=Thermus sp. TaxID=275 RepID=UPI003D0D741E